jgi:patatin-like phospholipase/acyl hydrolase
MESAVNSSPLTAPTAMRSVLSLDGGGAKGFYTLGVLREIEALVGQPLWKRFDLIFGTSTGAIIAALLALGHDVEEIHSLYKEYVPAIMGTFTARGKHTPLITLPRLSSAIARLRMSKPTWVSSRRAGRWRSR